ncbi:S9 family peptidase [Candidatus Fermentibacterales bacterium]|nr:S9 family peptidase [Candidatus Fermentibacterales bacterium]
MSRVLIAGLVMSMLVLACGQQEPGEAEPARLPEPDHVASPGAENLIPRELLFGNPEKVGPQVSPDGEQIAYIAPADGVLNLWVMDRDGGNVRQLTFDDNRGVVDYFWAEDDTHILYMQDQAGEEDTHVYRLDVETMEVTDLTPWDGVKAFVSATDEHQPNTVLVEMNRNDPMFFDVYSCDLVTGELTMLQENPGQDENGDIIVGYANDEQLNVRMYVGIDPMTGDLSYWVRDTPEDTWRLLMSATALDQVGPRQFSEDGAAVYMTSDLEANTTQLYLVDLATGGQTWIAGDSLSDVGGISWDPFTGEPRAVSYNYLRRRVEVLDERLQEEYDFLVGFHDGEFAPVSRDRADSTWIVLYSTIDNPAEYYVYDRTSGEMEFLFTAIPALEQYEMADMEPLLIESRDGLQLPSYLTLPKAGEPPYPTILLVHGGPWARDYYGYDPFCQLFADRGFAVLKVNFRGSGGFGKSFLNAGNKEWGAAMQDDLTDAVQWAIDEGMADPERIVILGGSYGGYAVLAGVAFTPDLYCCGVDFFGPSNLVTFRETVPPYWRPMDAMFDIRVGSLTEDREMLEERSPLNYVENITVPMFIVQGANDPRVVKAESDQVVAALREQGNEVLYAVYENEGHGFMMEPNRLDFAARTEEFLYLSVPGVECEMFAPVEGATVHLE